MDFHYTDVARDDIRDIVKSLKSVDKNVARKFLNELDVKKSMLTLFPLARTKIITPSLRLEYRFVKVNGFLLVYIINTELSRIEVSRILAERTDWKFHLR